MIRLILFGVCFVYGVQQLQSQTKTIKSEFLGMILLCAVLAAIIML